MKQIRIPRQTLYKIINFQNGRNQRKDNHPISWLGSILIWRELSIFQIGFPFPSKSTELDSQFGSYSGPNLIPRSVNPDCRKSQSVYKVNPFIWMGSIHSQIGRVCVWYRVLISGWPYQASSRLFCILHAAAARFYGRAKTEFGMEAVRSGAAAEKFSPLLLLACSRRSNPPEWYCSLNSAAQIIMWKDCRGWPRFGGARAIPPECCVTFA